MRNTQHMNKKTKQTMFIMTFWKLEGSTFATCAYFGRTLLLTKCLNHLPHSFHFPQGRLLRPEVCAFQTQNNQSRVHLAVTSFIRHIYFQGHHTPSICPTHSRTMYLTTRVYLCTSMPTKSIQSGQINLLVFPCLFIPTKKVMKMCINIVSPPCLCSWCFPRQFQVM
jgi:hypothetical protein